MSEYDQFVNDPTIESAARKRGLSREQAIDIGRQLGTDEADRRGDVGADRQERIERAMAYAAWDYDGRPSRGQPQVVHTPGRRRLYACPHFVPPTKVCEECDVT